MRVKTQHSHTNTGKKVREKKTAEKTKTDRKKIRKKAMKKDQDVPT